MIKTPVQVTISAAIVTEYEQRALDVPPYDRINKPGRHTLSEEEARELVADCKHQGNIGGDWIDNPPGTVRAYRALHKKITAAAR